MIGALCCGLRMEMRQLVRGSYHSGVHRVLLCDGVFLKGSPGFGFVGIQFGNDARGTEISHALADDGIIIHRPAPVVWVVFVLEAL